VLLATLETATLERTLETATLDATLETATLDATLLLTTTLLALLEVLRGATARPVDGSILPGHNLFALRFAAICEIAALVLV
jgi:hypothetical protein